MIVLLGHAHFFIGKDESITKLGDIIWTISVEENIVISCHVRYIRCMKNSEN